jgi:intracellular sulfur oxidation DsrE/DsrF family protein
MTTRKEFLAAGSLLAVTPQVAQAASTPARPLTFQFDQTRFNDILSKSAKHKQCFGIMKINGGAPLEGMMNSINAYDDFLKEGPGALQAVGVLYHGAAVGFAMNDTVWNEYLIPFLSHAPGPIQQDVGTVKPGNGNAYKEQVRELVGRGASFFVCHNAIAGISDLVASSLKTSAQSVHAAIMAAILPGAVVVPAGVMAVNACQEAKFTYIAT